MIVFDLNKYPDIDLDEFIKYVEDTTFQIPSKYIPLINNKYDVVFTFHRDWDNNRFTITGEIVDYSNCPVDNALIEALDDVNRKRKIRDHSVCEYYVPVHDEQENIKGFECSVNNIIFDEKNSETDVCQLFKNMYGIRE